MVSVATPISAQSGPVFSADIESALFGEDLLFTQGDLQITAAGDYANVIGLASVKQAVYNRLITAPGEYAVYPTYGVGILLYLKKRIVKSEIDALTNAIIAQLAQEDRIAPNPTVLVQSIFLPGPQGDVPGITVQVTCLVLGNFQTFNFTFSQ